MGYEMDFIKKHKALIIQVIVGALMAVIMRLIDLPIWLIGAIIAGTITIVTQYATKLYDDRVEPRIKETVEKRKAKTEEDTVVSQEEVVEKKPKRARKTKATAS